MTRTALGLCRTLPAILSLAVVLACTDRGTPGANSNHGAGASATTAEPRLAGDATPAPTPVDSSATRHVRAPGHAAAASAADLEPEPPRADPYDLARRYRRTEIPPTALTQPPPAKTGDVRRFFVYDLAATRAVEVNATLLAQTEHADIWVQEAARYGRTDAERAGDVFESRVYPEVTAAFGLPAAAPDGTVGRIAILHLGLRGAAGYFAGSDQLPRAIAPYSNEQQIVYLDANAARPGDRAYAGLLAHEFQHLVHQQHNPYADTWINEGLSEVADELLGGANSYLRRFETATDTQLDAWPAEGNTAAHYGAAHSFLRYVLHRFGGVERAGNLAGIGATGINSIARYLHGGFGAAFLDVFADWTVANLLDQDGDDRYSQPGVVHRVRGVEKASGSGDGEVAQLGADYLEIAPDGRDVTLRFDGDERVARVGVAPVSGRGMWWSGRADSLDSTLTREVDLRAVRSATLRFMLWFSIERDYDYAYVSASRDGGRTWDALAGRHTTTRDPLRVAFGPGYSGTSGGRAGWVEEEVDLSAYAGERILLRFEYVTDEAATEDGLALDDLTIPEAGWRDDGETDGDWQASGFVRLTNPLPQRFIVQLVEQDVRDAIAVRRIDLDAANDATVTIPRSVKKATLVVSGATLGTTLPAGYRWEVRR